MPIGLASWRVARLCPDRFTLLLAALAVLGVVLVMARQFPYGPGLDSDSVTYVSVARNLIAGEGLVERYGKPYTEWAPLHPMLIAGASLSVFDPKDVVGPLNAAIFGLTIFISGWWLRQRIRSRLLVIFGCLAIILSFPLAGLASWGLSEPAFVLFTTLSLIQTDRYIEGRKPLSLIWAAVFTAAACLTRYMGLAVIIAVGLILILQRGASPWERAKLCTLYTVVSASPICLWMLRNFLLVGEPTGTRNYSPYPLTDILKEIFVGMGGWIFSGFPLGILEPIASVLQIIAMALAPTFLAALIIAFGYVLIHSHAKSEFVGRLEPILIFGSFSLVYISLLIAAMSMGTTGHGVQSRFLTPVYIPLLFSALFILDALLIYGQEERPLRVAGKLPATRIIVQGWTLILIAPLFLWVVYGSAMTARSIAQFNGYNLEYASLRFVNSEVLGRIREAPIGGLTFSNVASAIYIHTDVPAEHHGLPREWDRLRELVANARDEVHIVWFNDYHRNHIIGYGPADLRAMPELDTIAELADGVIFKVKSSD